MDSERFPTTAWAIIDLAAAKTGTEFVEIFNEIVTAYWRPVYFFVRRRGWGEHEAEELTQEFLVSIAQGKLINRADRTRGRFRALLLTALKHFLADRSA